MEALLHNAVDPEKAIYSLAYGIFVLIVTNHSKNLGSLFSRCAGPLNRNTDRSDIFQGAEYACSPIAVEVVRPEGV